MKSPCQIGKKVIVLTTQYYYIGQIAEVTPFGLILENASIFLDFGYFRDVQKGNFANCEADPLEGFVAVPAIPNAVIIEYLGDLPREPISS